ncbi:hypothetical protein [Alkalicoccobacillus porphyridii]|uniref:DUF4052 domain-containing protein n=1 Tax=Alkalicoccobacillus porphyridii TaxID=2597270 RepID=A0A554A3I7_9BACI|nr:hypothetical protein [Alkalicoccobacillus porphyridii]TSB48253.1 hypothetical protein FN960_01490 [Alkalicoccobacillus porphyridii]
MGQVIAQLRLHSSELKLNITIFWTILVLVVIGFYSIAAIFGAVSMFVITNVPIYVFIAITAFRLVKDDFGYSIHLGSTRNRFVLSSMMYIIAVSLLFNIFNQLLLFTISILQGNLVGHFLTTSTWSSLLSQDTGTWSVFSNQYMSYLLNFGLDLLLSIFFGTLLYFLASLLYRFGQLAVYLALLAIILVLLIPPVHNELFDHIVLFHRGTNLTILWVVMASTILIPFLSLFTLSKASAS